MSTHGFVRVACAVPEVRVADCAGNAERILELMARAQTEQVDVLVFPELCLTGYTCGDLFHQPVLQNAARSALKNIAKQGAQIFTGLTVVGLPLPMDGQLYNCAAVVKDGNVLGIVPKTYLPNSREFYEARWFAPGWHLATSSMDLDGVEVPLGLDLLFDGSRDFPGLIIGVEICEDLWVPIPPSSLQALDGATLLLNLSASNEVIGKPGYRRELVGNQSGRCLAGYVYTCCGVQESTTDLIFAGHCLIAENGSILAESKRFERGPRLLVTDIDIDRLQNERQKTSSFGESQGFVGKALADCRLSLRERTFFRGAKGDNRRIPFAWQAPAQPRRLKRTVDAHPFVPSRQESLNERCQDIFHAQVAGLAKRLEHIGKPAITLGVSGGLDSTLALVVACKTLDLLAMQRTKLKALTMPGFGTSKRTLANAQSLMKHLGVTASEVDIRLLCLEEMRALGHRPFGIPLEGLSVDELSRRLREVPAEKRTDLVFENVQARMRTSLLMNTGFVIGTGDLSELALGWCTYNGDHMSMYNPNISIPKTLVKFLVRWAADNEFQGEVSRILLDVVGTEISPELLPMSADGQVTQATESVIGPYELHDFFLFHFFRYGAPPAKILYLAEHAKFDHPYAPDEIRRWLGVFLQRFFANQFKRSCLPDGPKVGTVSLSPRGDWRMPSDAVGEAWKPEPL